MPTTTLKIRLTMSCGALAVLAACEGGLPDFDLRDLGDGFDTSEAVANLPDRPAPDARGVISYPNYQVAVAQNGDTVQALATRLGQDAGALARFNGLAVDATLRAGELIALPARVSEPTEVPTAPGGLDVAAIATTALDRVDATTPATPAPVATPPSAGVEPIRHKVQSGETVFQISRLYNVPVSNIAEWNSLGSDLTVREGQFLLIPQAGSRRPGTAAPVEAVTEPGEGTSTPVPPSSTTPLPAETPTPAPAPEATPAVPEAPDLGTPTTPEPSSARLVRPVDGNIIREYAPGRNEGIDIAVPAGTSVKAADSGSVAAVTTDTNGVAIVVIRHDDNLLTVYTNMTDLTVEKGGSVSRGQTIGKIADGSPSFLHFETRRGLQSVDPAEFLP